MYDAVMRIRDLCASKNIPISKLETDCGLSNGYLNPKKLKKIPYDRAVTISKYLSVTAEYILTGSNTLTCIGCGMRYNPTDSESCSIHQSNHKEWEKVVSKYGFCWSYDQREQEKTAARAIINNNESTDEQYISAQITVFKALFSRSLEQNQYSLSHPVFDDYVAMLLNQPIQKQSIRASVYAELVKKYGTLTGIEHGTIYEVKIDEHFCNESISIEERELLFAYRNATPEIRNIVELALEPYKSQDAGDEAM